MRLPVLLGLWGLLSGAGSVRLRLEPDSDQFFSSEKIKLICEGQTERWNLKRTTRDKTAQTCGRGQEEFGQIESSSCVVATPSPSDSGSYWCQDGSGTTSQEVHLSVTGGDLILDSPVLPVETGSDVTLHCRVRRGSGVKPEIFRNSSLFQPSPDWTIFNVSRSDQGFYSCSGLNKSGLRVTSEERWLRVKDSSHPPMPSFPVSLLFLLRRLLVGSPYCIITVLLVSIYSSHRKTGSKQSVSMETSEQGEEPILRK